MSSDLRILSRSYQSEIDFGSEDRGIKEIQDLIPNPECVTSQDQSTNDVSRSLWRDQRNNREKGFMDIRSHNTQRKNLFPEVEQDCQNLTPNSGSRTPVDQNAIDVNRTNLKDTFEKYGHSSA